MSGKIQIGKGENSRVADLIENENGGYRIVTKTDLGNIIHGSATIDSETGELSVNSELPEIDGRFILVGDTFRPQRLEPPDTSESSQSLISSDSRVVPSKKSKPIFGTGQSLVLTIICACLIAGGGQIVNRQVVKGCIFFVVSLTCGFFANMLAPLIYLLAMIDAIVIGRRLQRGEAVTQWQLF